MADVNGLVLAPLAATTVALVGLDVGHRLLPVRGRRRAVRSPRPGAPRSGTVQRPIATRVAGRAGGTRAVPLVRRPPVPTDADVATWCDRLARRVRAGDTLGAAIRTVEPPPSTRAAVAPIVLALDRGADVTAAVRAAPIRSAGLDTALTVIGACARLGGPAAEPLDRVASALRRRVAETADRRTQSAQARASALTLTVLPVAFVVVMTGSSTSVRAGVTSTPGAVAVAVGLALNLAGWCWMRRIIRGAS